MDYECFVATHAATHFLTEEVKCSVFLASLLNDAKVWAKVFGRRYQTYEALKAAFLRRFWGYDVQWRIKDEFAYGTYRQRGAVSKMGKYFIGMLRRVSYLPQPPSEQEFIETSGAHFPFHLQQQMKRLSSIEDAYLLLIHRDRTISYSARLNKLRQQRKNEQDKARTPTESYCYACCGSNDDAESTDSTDNQPRRLGGGDVTVRTSMTPKTRRRFNPVQRFSVLRDTLSKPDEIDSFGDYDEVNEPGSRDSSSVLCLVDKG
nr:uncharacterized protein LOC115266710 [Aedes albopictus]